MMTLTIPTTVNGYPASQYQMDIFKFVLEANGHLVVIASAGASKSTTLVEAARLLSPDCKAIFAAFNNHIAKELGEKLREAGSTMECRTVHSLGKSILDRQFKSGKVDSNKYRNLCRDYLATKGYDSNSFTTDMSKLVDAIRLTLTNPKDEEAINKMITHYGIDLDFDYAWDDVLAGIPKVLELGRKLYEAGVIDFTDMLYLPATLDIPCPKYEILMLDEAQDFNAAQLALIMKCCAVNGRMFFVADPKQAIQGFAFADTNSVQNIIDKVQPTVKPLSICYRCARSVVEMAQQIVPTIEPSPTAIDGTVEAIREDQFITLVQPGDMVICRTTAPLVSQCLTLLRAGIKAMVRGKDIGKSFIDIIKKLQKRRGFCLEALGDLVENYRHEQLNILANVPDNEMKVASLNDKVDTFIALLESYLNKSGDNGSIVGFEEYINSFFTDDEGIGVKPVMFSTVHKAKGLEANRVFILEPGLFPHPAAKKAWQLEQEYNIEYVAVTRAKKELYFVGGLPSNLHFKDEVLIEEEEAIATVEEIINQPVVVESTLADALISQPDEQQTVVEDETSKSTKRTYGGRKPLPSEDKRVFFQSTWDVSIRQAFKAFTEAENAKNDTHLSEGDMLEQMLLTNPTFASFFQDTDYQQAYNDRQARAEERRQAYKGKRAKKVVEPENNNPDDDPNGGGIPTASNPVAVEEVQIHDYPDNWSESAYTHEGIEKFVEDRIDQNIATSLFPAAIPTSGKVKRVAYTCLRPSCRKSWLTDYWTNENSVLFRFENGKMIYQENDFQTCPHCQNPRQYIRVTHPKRSYSSSRKCDSRCRNARPGSPCHCQCNGAGHGLGEGNANLIGHPLLEDKK